LKRAYAPGAGLYFDAIEAEGVEDDGEAGEHHGGGGDSRGEDVEHGQGDGGDVVGEGPEEVLADDAEGAAGEFESGRDSHEAVGCEQDVTGAFGEVGAGGHGDAEIGGCEGRGVVDAVAEEGDAAFGYFFDLSLVGTG